MSNFVSGLSGLKIGNVPSSSSHPPQIPLSAVEMPGSADVSGLNVQFGALDFGPEASLPDFSHPDNGSSGITSTNRDPVPVSQPLNSHYSKSPRSGAV